MVPGIHKMLIFSEVISKYVQIIIMSNSTENNLCRRQQNQTKYLKDMNLKQNK
jgi:hypothetical protein